MYNNLPALTENILWDERLIAVDYGTLSEETLRSALKDYLQAVRSYRNEEDIFAHSPLSLWMTHFDQLALYRPGLLSAERIILPDALEEAALRLGSTDLALAVDLLVQNRHTDRLDDIRHNMARFVRFVREHFSLIQAGFIIFTPSESLRQEQQRKIGFTDENAERSFLSSVMPPAIVEHYMRSLKVRGVERVSEEGHIRFVPENRLPGEIRLELKDCLSSFTNGHMFQNIRPVKENEDGSLTVEIIRGKLRNRSHYEHWVRGAVNRSLYFHYTGLLTDLNQADQSGASLATRCPFQGKVLEKLSAPGGLSRRMLEIELPFLPALSPDDLFRIRTDYEPSATAFRRALRECALEMERAANPNEIRLLQTRFQERIADEGLEDLQEKLRGWKRRSLQDVALLAAPAVLGYIGAPAITSLAAGALAVLQGTVGAYRNYQDVTRHPSWFLLRTGDLRRLKK
ncbi:hypothetical protein [Klebsiella aerogenes]|uniref:hypothetical protein n=1 Tax=Klebsiella aerogenes TaxID=548 RepID=UPI0007B3DCEF|nr:hypothetical protein [Klebsiella aerogenes]KZR19315.1 hypothetical protein A3N54_17765 [Klebsiella aerogenes]